MREMLAPLKNRAILEQELCDCPDGVDSAEQRPLVRPEEEEIADLRAALRRSRRAHRKSAALSARQLVAQANEIDRLKELNAGAQQRLAELESGQAIVGLGRKLVSLGEANRALMEAARRVPMLESALCTAHAEYIRLSLERDFLAMRQGAETTAHFVVAGS